MNYRTRFVLLPLALLATFAPVEASAQSSLAQLSPGVYHYDNVPEVPANGFQQSNLTYRLRGRADLTLREVGIARRQSGSRPDPVQPERAVVACWICEDGSCGEGQGWGPAVQVFGSLPMDRAVSLPFDLMFGRLPIRGRRGRLADPANVSSYYCNLRFALVVDGLPDGQLHSPNTSANESDPTRALKGALGTSVVWELRGRAN